MVTSLNHYRTLFSLVTFLRVDTFDAHQSQRLRTPIPEKRMMKVINSAFSSFEYPGDYETYEISRAFDVCTPR